MNKWMLHKAWICGGGRLSMVFIFFEHLSHSRMDDGLVDGWMDR
jgi:hypothetical protein